MERMMNDRLSDYAEMHTGPRTLDGLAASLRDRITDREREELKLLKRPCPRCGRQDPERLPDSVCERCSREFASTATEGADDDAQE